MSCLAIKGHVTRGKEVIEILEMLGGRNVRNYACNLTDYAYSINGQGIIDWYIPHPNSPLVIYTLEEFLEKFPYKVGDKVKIPNCVVACRVTNMIWNGIDMEYETTNSEETFFDDELQPYKEETMEENTDTALAPDLKGEDYSGRRFGYQIPKGYEFECGRNNEIILKPIKPQYPKTYEECAKVLLERASVRNDIGYKGDLIVTLQKLLVCRDAYWKIAGEQMGLGKLWKPDWEKADEKKYCIVNTEGNVAKWVQKTTNKILAFPTEEMRDAFYENFKDLIELVKELL